MRRLDAVVLEETEVSRATVTGGSASGRTGRERGDARG